MKKYEFNATNYIAEVFEAHGVKFGVDTNEDFESVKAGFAVDNGPAVIMNFISRDNDNDVAIRIIGLVMNTPKEKRTRVMEACNQLNCKNRYLKFTVSKEGIVNVEYDFPVKAGDECVGEMALEIFIRTMRILDEDYAFIAKALYTDVDLEM